MFELTENGRLAAQNAGIPLPVKQSRGGLEHNYWIHQTVQFLRKLEFQPVLEFNNIDVTEIEVGLAIEIETGKSDYKSNLLKLKNSRVSKCYMLATNKAALSKILECAPQYPTIIFLHVKDFLKLNKENLSKPTADNE